MGYGVVWYGVPEVNGLCALGCAPGIVPVAGAGKSSEYNSKSPDDAIKLLPELSDRGVEYYGAWLKYLLTAEQELEASGERTTTDPNEIDIYYISRRSGSTILSRRTSSCGSSG